MYPAAFLAAGFLPYDRIQDLLRKRDHHAAGDSKKTVRPLAGIMTLQRQTNLHDAESQQDQTDRADQAENECAEVIDDRDRVAGGISRRRADGKRKDQAAVRQHREPGPPLFLLIFQRIKFFLHRLLLPEQHPLLHLS